VASIGPQNNFSAFRARSSNYELKEVYLPRNCSSQCLIKRERQTSVESLYEVGDKKPSTFRAAVESEPHYSRLTVDLSSSGQ